MFFLMPTDPVISHWHHLAEGFQTSTKGFYASVEELLERRAVPQTQTSRIQWPEAGALSSWREYLRVERLGFRFEVCAAPFGSGFFVSWWLVRPLPMWWAVVGWHIGSLMIMAVAFACLYSLLLGTAAGAAKLAAMAGADKALGMLGGILGVVFVGWFPSLIGAVGAVLLVYHLTVRLGLVAVETVESVLILGWLYIWVFRPLTYYRLDTALMFRDAVHAAVLEAWTQTTAGKGVRTLSRLERRPLMERLTRA